jgi:hypothetical protein
MKKNGMMTQNQMMRMMRKKKMRDGRKAFSS